MIIPGVTEKIIALLRDHDLTPEHDPTDFVQKAESKRKYIYSTQCAGPSAEKYFFKALIVSGEAFRQTLIQEITVFTKLGGMHFESFSVPEILESGQADLVWYLRRSAQGDIIGDPFVLKGGLDHEILNYDGMAEKFLAELASIEHNQTNRDLFSGLSLDLSTKRGYLEAIEENGKIIDRFYPEFTSRSCSLFSDYRFPESNDFVLCHGDCHLGNLIFGPSEPTVIDWGAHWGNVAEDFAKVWTSLWQYPRAQDNFAVSFLNDLEPKQQRIFNNCLLQMIIYQAANKLSWFYMIKNGQTKPENNKYYSRSLVDDGARYFEKLVRSVHRGNWSLVGAGEK